MNEEEKNEDKLNKQSQLKRLNGFLDPIAKYIVNDLEVTHSIKREQDRVLNERIAKTLNGLRYYIMMFLLNKINSFSISDLQKVIQIRWRDGEETVELFPFIVEASFRFSMDVDGQPYALAGTGFTPLIKMKDMVSRKVAESPEEVKDLTKRISGYLEGIAKICYQPIDGNTDEFRISYNIAGLIHENAQSLKD